MNLISEQLKNIIISVHQEKGIKWLESFNILLDKCCEKWSLSSITPFNNLSYNFVAIAEKDNEKVVLKVGVPCNELFSEIQALKLYAGNASVKLIDFDTDLGAILMEYIFPGNTLSSINDEQKITSIAAGVMKNLWKPEPENHSFLSVDYWFKGFERLRNTFNGGTGPFPENIIEKAEKIYAEFVTYPEKKVILHGDLHHDNILQKENSWLAIDPKGIVGEPAFEPSAFLTNYLLNQDNPKEVLARRIEQFSEELNIEKEKIWRWGFAQTILSAWWSYEDNLPDWKTAIECAELF